VTRFADLTLTALLDEISSAAPTPGGGTAAAIAGAMGTSLLIMVTGLAKSKTSSDDEKAALATARAALSPIRERLMQFADADTEAFDQVMAAYRLPKASDAEKSARSAAIQLALQQATRVPLDTLRACAAALHHGIEVADAGNRSASSDAGVAIGLLAAAAAGAEANVRANLGGIKDEGFASAAVSEVSRLASEAAGSAGEARRRLAG
jgi:formiminotetrahydrofolate cyclodeaminase